MKNDVHWFEWNAGKKEYEVALDRGNQKKRAIETLDYLNELHKFSPEASNYNWGELMSTYVAEKAATSWYVGARLLEQVNANNARIADATLPFELPRKLTDHYYLSIQGFHILEKSNIEGAKKYVRYFMEHPSLIAWYHAVPLHIIPASRDMLRSSKYQDNPVIQKRMDVLKFLDSIWGKGVPLYYWDGKELNPYIGLYHNENLAGWMLAARNIKGMKSDAVVDEAAGQVRKKMRRAA
jgi:multiple sugar transport system substrate-binding protein